MVKNTINARNLLDLIIPIRIDDDGQFTFQELVKFTVDHPKVVLIKEYKDPVHNHGPHYHGWAFKDEIPMITLRKHINDQLHCKGNGQYSFKKDKSECPSVDGYFRYCSKGTKNQEPIEFHNITKDEILDYHTRYWIEWSRIQESKKYEKDSFKNSMLEYFQEHRPSTPNGLMIDIIGFFETKDKLNNDNDILKYYYYIRGKLDPEYKNIRGRLLFEKAERVFL